MTVQWIARDAASVHFRPSITNENGFVQLGPGPGLKWMQSFVATIWILYLHTPLFIVLSSACHSSQISHLLLHTAYQSHFLKRNASQCCCCCCCCRAQLGAINHQPLNSDTISRVKPLQNTLQQLLMMSIQHCFSLATWTVIRPSSRKVQQDVTMCHSVT